MRLLYELSWLWEMMGIAMAAAVVCVACAALICKAAKKKLSRKVIAVVAAAAFAGSLPFGYGPGQCRVFSGF